MSTNMNNNDTNNNVSLETLSEGAIPTSVTPMNTALPKFKASDIKTVSEHEIAPKKEQKINPSMPTQDIANAFKDIDLAIERTASESMDIIRRGEEARAEEAFLNDDYSKSEPSVETTSSDIIMNVDDDVDFDDDSKPTTTFSESIQPVDPKPIMNMNSGYKEDVIPKVDSANLIIPNSDEEPDIVVPVDEDDFDIDLDSIDINPNVAKEEEAKHKQEEIASEEFKKEQLECIKNAVNKSFKPIENPVDLSSFKISKKTISAGKVIDHLAKTASAASAVGVLYSLKRAVKMSKADAMEIENNLNPRDIDSRNPNSNINDVMVKRCKMIYDHIIDDTKPATFEGWAKITPVTALDDYFFTLYRATYNRSNIITYVCTKSGCPNVAMVQTDLDKMVKFKNDEVKAEYENILKRGITQSGGNTYDVGMFQLSDEYACTLRKPSIYDVYIGPTLLNQEFANKYKDFIILCAYIDQIFVISRTNGALIPIDFKPDKTRPDVTFKRRIKVISNVLKSISSDQLQRLNDETDKYDDTEYNEDGDYDNSITYVYPEYICDKCGTKIEESEVDPAEMLFTRHRLGLYYRISNR